jgi:soluble lytic murein transglycosylase-like protein
MNWLSRADLELMADDAADQAGVPRRGFRALVGRESGWRIDVVSPRGAIGLAQLMPGTAGDLGVDPWDPAENLLGGAFYLAEQRARFGSWPAALAAYNWGPANVGRAIDRYGGAWRQHLPAETTTYVDELAPAFGGGGGGLLVVAGVAALVFA